MPFNPPKTFGQPDVLKTITPGILIEILKPCHAFLEANGLPLPESADAGIDYLHLAAILATPDECMDAHVIEALHVITTVGKEGNFDELLAMARRNFIDVDLEATACDLAARIWLVAPQMLQLKDREQMVERRRRFESFRARDPKIVVPLEKLPTDLGQLQLDLEAAFQSKHRGIGCVVVRNDIDGEAHFLIQHGQPCKRVPSRKGAVSTCTLYRPEQTDTDASRKRQNVRIWHIGTHWAKQEFYDWLRIVLPDDGTFPPGYQHYAYKDQDFYRGLCSESRIIRSSGKVEWVPDKSVRNEPLDLAVLCRAAAAVCGIDRFTDDDWAALEGTAPEPPPAARRDDYFGNRGDGWFGNKDWFK